MVRFFYTPSILIWIKKMFKHAEKHHWNKTYWFFDIHGVISRPDYRKTTKKLSYYPYVKETLQYITKYRPDIVMVLFTSSYPDEIKEYMSTFIKDEIYFKYINENPEISTDIGCFGCYDKKSYYNVLFEDKAGFDPETDWKPIYKFLKKTKYIPNPEWTFKVKESYHDKNPK